MCIFTAAASARTRLFDGAYARGGEPRMGHNPRVLPVMSGWGWILDAIRTLLRIYHTPSVHIRVPIRRSLIPRGQILREMASFRVPSAIAPSQAQPRLVTLPAVGGPKRWDMIFVSVMPTARAIEFNGQGTCLSRIWCWGSWEGICFEMAKEGIWGFERGKGRDILVLGMLLGRWGHIFLILFEACVLSWTRPRDCGTRVIARGGHEYAIYRLMLSGWIKGANHGKSRLCPCPWFFRPLRYEHLSIAWTLSSIIPRLLCFCRLLISNCLEVTITVSRCIMPYESCFDCSTVWEALPRDFGPPPPWHCTCSVTFVRAFQCLCTFSSP